MAGTVTASGNNATLIERKDACVDGKVLEEQYCDDGLLPASLNYSCSDKCLDGRCVSGVPGAASPFWQVGESGTVREKKVDAAGERLTISFAAQSAHPHTGDVYLVSSAPMGVSNKKLAAEAVLGNSVQTRYYDEYGAVIVLSPEKYLDADLMDDAADNSKTHFTTAVRCWSMLNDVNSGKISYVCEKRENGKTTQLLEETIGQGINSTKVKWEFHVQKKQIGVTMDTPTSSRKFSIEDGAFASQFADSHLYLGEYSSSGQSGAVTIRDVTLQNKPLNLSLGAASESPATTITATPTPTPGAKRDCDRHSDRDAHFYCRPHPVFDACGDWDCDCDGDCDGDGDGGTGKRKKERLDSGNGGKSGRAILHRLPLRRQGLRPGRNTSAAEKRIDILLAFKNVR